MRNDTRTGIMALLLAGEIAGSAEAAQPYPSAQADPSHPHSAAVVELRGYGRGYPLFNASPVIVARANEQDGPAIPSQTQYIGGELQQMNLR